jgi:hypothetical protein
VCGIWNDFCKEHWPELYATSFAEPDENHQGCLLLATTNTTVSYGV